MTRLEIINEAITSCKNERDYYAKKCYTDIESYYQGRMEAFEYARHLILLDKKFNDYSF